MNIRHQLLNLADGFFFEIFKDFQHSFTAIENILQQVSPVGKQRNFALG